MARLTSDELREARRKKQGERRAAQEEAEKLMAQKKNRLQSLEETRQQWELLDSVLDGLYSEIDKLTKKAPADEITELALRRVNELIKQAKVLLKGDPFIDSIDPFIAAGENPEHRDVLLILREIQQGMRRQRAEYRQLEEDREEW